MREASTSSQKQHLWLMHDQSVATHWTEDVGRGVMLIRINYFDIAILLSPEEVEKRRRRISLFRTWRVRTCGRIQLNEIGIRAKNKMIEIFNLGLNSSVSRDEMQTKRPFGEKDMDYKILLLVHRHRQSLSRLISCWRLCFWCYCMLYSHPEEYVMTVINVSFPVTPFKQKILIFLVLQPLESLSVALPALQQEIGCVSCYGSQ